jgi:hypothetical protein
VVVARASASYRVDLGRKSWRTDMRRAKSNFLDHWSFCSPRKAYNSFAAIWRSVG